MAESILNSVKKLVNVDADYKAFDIDIIIHINSALSRLHQLGVGPKDPLVIENDTTTWDDFFEGKKHIQNAKTYVGLYVRMMFDTPQSGGVISVYEKELNKLEWLLNVAVDPSGV